MSLLFLVAGVLWGGPAAGPVPVGPGADSAPPTRVVALPPRITGTTEAGAAERLRAAYLDGLARGRATVVPPRDDAASCADAPCRRALAEQHGVGYVAMLTVTTSERDYAIRVEVSSGEKGEIVATLEESCDICGVDEVAGLVADLGARTQAKIELLDRHVPRLAVGSTPAGARVLVDGALVGTTPWAGDVSAGPHVVRVEQDGFLPRERRWVAVEGTDETFDEPLQPNPRAADDERRRLRAAGAASLGIGLAFVGAGIPLLVLDSKEYRGKCEGANVDVHGTCRWSYDTLAGGIAAVVGGGAALIVGAALLGRARVLGRRSAGPQAGLPIPTGRGVAWALRF